MVASAGLAVLRALAVPCCPPCCRQHRAGGRHTHSHPHTHTHSNTHTHTLTRTHTHTHRNTQHTHNTATHTCTRLAQRSHRICSPYPPLLLPPLSCRLLDTEKNGEDGGGERTRRRARAACPISAALVGVAPDRRQQPPARRVTSVGAPRRRRRSDVKINPAGAAIRLVVVLHRVHPNVLVLAWHQMRNTQPQHKHRSAHHRSTGRASSLGARAAG